MPITIDLPISARDLETRLHDFCDHHGWDNAVIGSEYQKPNGEYAIRLIVKSDGQHKQRHTIGHS